MEDQEIIIVDAEGGEHHFPAGMDPKKAAQIVQQQMYKPDSPLLHRGETGFSDRTDEGSTIKGMVSMGHGMAHPSTLTDFASLLIPSGLGMAKGGIGRVQDNLVEFAGRSKQAFKGAAAETPSGVRGIMSFPGKAYSKFKDALPSSNEKAVETFRGGPKPIKYDDPKRMWEGDKMGVENPRPKPDIIDRGMRPEPSNARGGRTPAPPYRPQAEPIQIADPHMPNKGGVPDSGIPQDDELLRALMDDAVDPHMANQSGIPDAGIDQGVMPTSSMSEVDQFMPNKSGVGEPPIGAGAGGASTPEGAVLGEPIPTPDASGPEELRRMFGSRDAASQLGMSKDELLQAAPGPSHTPISVENKMNDASFDRIINQDPEMQDPMLRALIEQLFGRKAP